DILSDPKKRQMYDQFGHAGPGMPPGGGNPFGGAGPGGGPFQGGFGGFDPRSAGHAEQFQDIFGDFFGDVFGQAGAGGPRRGPGGFRQAREERGADLRYTL